MGRKEAKQRGGGGNQDACRMLAWTVLGAGVDDLGKYSPGSTLASRLNATPRRCLGYRTPAEVFNGRLGTAPAEAGTIAAVSH